METLLQVDPSYHGKYNTSFRFYATQLLLTPLHFFPLLSVSHSLTLSAQYTVVCFWCKLLPNRTITNNLPSVPLPKVPNLPLNLPQMPSFSAPAWMGPLCDSTCVWAGARLWVAVAWNVLSLFVVHACVVFPYLSRHCGAWTSVVSSVSRSKSVLFVSLKRHDIGKLHFTSPVYCVVCVYRWNVYVAL